jgi:hypothetical protein
MADGWPAADVLAAVTRVVGGQPVYADCYLDAGWMRTLEMAAGAPPLIRVRHIDAFIDSLSLDDQAVSRAVLAAGDPSLRRHRAGDDALWLQSLASELTRYRQPAFSVAA